MRLFLEHFSWDEPNLVSVKFMKGSTSSLVKFVWMNLDRPTRFIRLLKKIKTYEYHLDPG